MAKRKTHLKISPTEFACNITRDGKRIRGTFHKHLVTCLKCQPDKLSLYKIVSNNLSKVGINVPVKMLTAKHRWL